jgi:hypothetical protein
MSVTVTTSETNIDVPYEFLSVFVRLLEIFLAFIPGVID